MSNLNLDIFNYVNSKSGSWSSSTITTAYAKLCSIDTIGFRDPKKLYQGLVSKGLKPYSIQNYFILASRFEQEKFKTKRIQEWMQSNRLYFKNVYKEKIKTLTDEQFRSFLKAAPTSDLYNFLVLMGKAGLRKSEAFSIKWADIQDNVLTVIGKGGKKRTIPFSMQWLNAESEKLKTILPANLSYWQFFKEDLPGFTPHDLRSYYANRVTNMPGMSIYDARDMLGHVNINTTAKYLRADKDRQQKLILENFK